MSDDNKVENEAVTEESESKEDKNTVTVEVNDNGVMKTLEVSPVSKEQIEADERKCRENEDDFYQSMSAVRTRLLTRVPFFGHLCLKLRPRLARLLDNVPTAGVAPDGSLIVNYEFWSKLPTPQKLGLLCHEVMHPALQFWERKSTRSIKQFNIAHDFAINALIKAFNNPDIELPPKGLYDEKYKDWMAEVIYEDIDENNVQKMINQAYGQDGNQQGPCPDCGGTGKDQNQDSGQQGQDGNGNEGSNGQGQDQGQQGQGQGPDQQGQDGCGGNGQQQSDGSCPTCSGSGQGQGGGQDMQGDCREDLASTPDGRKNAQGDDNAKRRLETEWKVAIVEAAQQQEKHQNGQGSLPAALQRIIDDLIEPKIDWRQALARFIGDFGKRQDYSYRRPSRRSDSVGEFMPSFVPRGCDVLVLVDTSGSMGKDRVREAASEVDGICEDMGVTVRLMVCDAQLYHDVTVEDGLEAIDKMVGGGGSNFMPAFNAMEETGFDGVVIAITDGAITVPQTKPPQIREVVWLIHKMESAPAEWGDVIRIEDE